MKPRSYIDERIAERRRRALSGALAAAALAAAAFSVLIHAGTSDEPAAAPLVVATSGS